MLSPVWRGDKLMSEEGFLPGRVVFGKRLFRLLLPLEALIWHV